MNSNRIPAHVLLMASNAWLKTASECGIAPNSELRESFIKGYVTEAMRTK